MLDMDDLINGELDVVASVDGSIEAVNDNRCAEVAVELYNWKIAVPHRVRSSGDKLRWSFRPYTHHCQVFHANTPAM